MNEIITANIQPVGWESEAHPALTIIPSLNLKRYHLPPIQGYKYRFERNGGSLNKANSQPSSRDRALPDCRGGNQRDAHSHPCRGWRVPQRVSAKCLALPSANAGLKAEGGMRFAFPPYVGTPTNGWGFFRPLR